jgi:glucose/arabinose dehydrogenase
MAQMDNQNRAIIFVLPAAMAILAAGIYMMWRFQEKSSPGGAPPLVLPVEGPKFFTSPEPQSTLYPTPKLTSTPQSSEPKFEVVAENLNIPWEIAFLPDGTAFVTERAGLLLHINFRDGSRRIVKLEGVEHTAEGGLMGIALHPRFRENGWVYLYLTSRTAGGLENRVERYRWNGENLVERQNILENIPAAAIHDGGRIAFGPDGYLYITTGDAANPSLAQDKNSLAGKILRLRDDGTIPPDNPFGNAVWSYGHRNPQGLTWDSAGRLWVTEHGPSGTSWPNCCQDELNLIEKGKNYGWPESVGDNVKPGTVGPVLHSAKDTWAPASAVYWENPYTTVGEGSIFFVGLRGEALYEAVLEGNHVRQFRTHYKGEFGRLRALVRGPDGMFYLSTSNRDGRGTPRAGDDKIIRLDPRQLL